MRAIYKREMLSYFTSPMGYIFMAVFMAMSGILFSFSTFLTNSTETSGYFMLLLFIFIVVIPLLTMKLMSEERKLKTEQILLTAPVSIPAIILAKFFAAFTMFFITFILSEIMHFAVLSRFADNINYAQVFGTIIGVLLIGAAFIAVGLFISSLTESQIVAAISTIATILVLICISYLASYIPNAFVAETVRWFAILSRFSPFTIGILDLASIVYYISLAVIFIFLSVRVYEKRRWS
ncbi:MAG: ABC transporter permease [Clostridia bacterium]|nr:ABC transporter permease [Clostridia bacterium]